MTDEFRQPITSAMIRAGVEAWRHWHDAADDRSENLVREVYVAMRQAEAALPLPAPHVPNVNRPDKTE